MIIAYIILVWFLYLGHFDSESDKTKNSSNPQQHGKTTEQLFTELHPLWRGRRWSQSIRAITLVEFISLLLGVTLQM